MKPAEHSPAPSAASGTADVQLPLLILVGALGGFAYLVAMALEYPTLKLVVKMLPVLSMALWVRFAGADARIVAGLVFGAIGDLCLALPNAFLPGMIAFAIGHGMYVRVFAQWNPAPQWRLALPVVAYISLMLALMLPGTGALMVPVAIYISIIGAMAWRAAAVASLTVTDASRNQAQYRWLALAGALLFTFSDTLIGINRFVTPLPGSGYAIIVTYWAGQCLIAASAVARHALVNESPSHQR